MFIDYAKLIYKLPFSAIKRMQLERETLLTIKRINKILGRKRPCEKFYALVEPNRYYGNEHLLRNYAGMNEDLYALIEHGVFFGNNTAKVPPVISWDLGCILTYGEYRKNLINSVYPDYYCEAIGAPIFYADEAKVESYRRKIIAQLQISGKALLFFPAHGLTDLTPRYFVESLTDQLIALANENRCENIIISSYFTNDDLYRQLQDKARGIRICTYSCGERWSLDFLIRQNALISLCTVTASNSLGTHIGNCVGLYKPHVLLKQDIIYEGNTEREFGQTTRSINWKDQFAIETEMFEKMFAPTGKKAELTQEQYQFCDYYWGFSKKKTPEEIREIYKQCHEYALEYIKSNKERQRAIKS